MIVAQQGVPCLQDAVVDFSQAFTTLRPSMQRVGEACNRLVWEARTHLGVGQPFPATMVRFAPARIFDDRRRPIPQYNHCRGARAPSRADERDGKGNASETARQRFRLLHAKRRERAIDNPLVAALLVERGLPVANEPDAGAHVLNTPNIQVVFSGTVQWDCTMSVPSAALTSTTDRQGWA